MPRRVLKPVVLVACVVATLLATSAPASADLFPGNGDSTVADNSTHTYCYTSGFTTDPSVASYAMSVLGSTTDVSDLFPPAPPTCWFMETDVWWIESDLPALGRGVRDCWLESPNGICTSSDVELDFAQLDDGDFDWEDRRKTALHEVGHSLGLDDGTAGAMMSGQVPDASLTWRRFSAHDLGHLNAAY